MSVEILPADDIAAHSLLDGLHALAAQPQAAMIEHVAQQFANHRVACNPGPLAWKLDQAYTALLVAGWPDDELVKRLKAARDSARNLGKERAA